MLNKLDRFIPFETNIESTTSKINLVADYLKAEIIASGKVTRWHARYSDHLSLILLNLFNVYSIDTTLYVAYSRNKGTYTNLRKSRYSIFKLSYDSMVNMVDASIELGYIEGAKGFYDRVKKNSRTAKMKATDKLIELFRGYNVNPCHFTYNSAEEVIILKTKDPITKKKFAIEYEDTVETIVMRSNLQIINDKIQSHFIGLNVCDDTLIEINNAISGTTAKDCEAYDIFDDYEEIEDNIGEVEGTWKNDIQKYKPYLDMSKIKLKRIFNNGSFEQGGRYYGTWWQAVPSKYRPYIAIDDQQTIEIDFSGIHINLLYMLEGLPLPTDDVYTIEGLPKESRNVLKVALQILLNSQNEVRALNSIKRKFPVKENPSLFQNCTHEQIIEIFKGKHNAISHYFYKGVGVRLQFMDSQIAEDILVELSVKGIVVLPIHDSFIVRKDYSQILKSTMQAVVLKRFNQVLKLKEDRTAYDNDRDILYSAVPVEDLPASEEEYLREWLSEKRYGYLQRRDIWYSERGV